MQLQSTTEQQISSTLNLAVIYHNLHQNDSAAFYANRILQTSGEERTPYTLATVYALLTKIEKAGNNYQKALEYREAYTEQMTKISAEKEKQSIAGIQEKYALELVKTKNQQLLIQRLWFIVIGVVIVLLLTGGLFILYYRNSRQKINLLKAKEERRKLYARRVDVLKQTNLLEHGLKKAEREQYAGILPKIKQIIYDSAGELTWDVLYNALNEQYDSALDCFKKEMSQLTEPEFKICCLVYAGFSNEEIATVLQFRLNTVKTRKVSIGRKLGMTKNGNLQKFLTQRSG
jgi:ATP/maltotriose-dependent transcriptional regulator MalT